MKFSEKWLREWVNPSVTTEELSEQLSMAGLEVDAVDPVAGQFSGVVVGEVVACGQHPDADKLQVTKVNVGEDELLDIVCGAPNCRAGLKVAVAKVGAVLPGDFKIKKAKLRGQPSFGMLCSFSELGMGDDHSGILELPTDAPVGTDIIDYLNLDDNCIEVDLTPNRADCLGIRGIAREVGVLNNIDVCEPEVTAVEATIDDQISVTLHAPEACPRYLGRIVKGVDVTAPSPLWLVEKLRRCGVRSIDPIVDVTNFVLLELGQPMHAFNLAAIDGGINVRFANEDEPLTLLDEQEVKLKANTLVIADDNKPLAMAGIFGGLHSGVTAATQDILLESAFFSRDAIQGKARQYGLHTDASHRYERGVDTQLQRVAMERATALILAICGGQAGPIVEGVSETHIPVCNAVVLRRSRLDRVLGTVIDDDTVTQILSRLGLNPVKTDAGWETQAPSYRFDIAIEEDLIEEVVRVFGYNSVPNVAPQAALKMLATSESDIPLGEVKQVLLKRGYNEAITYSFVDPKIQQLLHPNADAMVLPHPISADMSAMRVSLLTGLLGAASYNQKRQQARIRLFETGLKFIPDSNESTGAKQQPVVGGVLVGNRTAEHWLEQDTAVDFFDAKGDVEALLSLLVNQQNVRFAPSSNTALHPGLSADIYVNDDVVGFVGALHPQFTKKVGINGRPFVFELDLAALAKRSLPQATTVSKFPANRRDIAILVKQDVAVGDIISCIEKIGVNQLVDLNLFDVYTGQGIEAGYKSLAIALILQDNEKTLEDNEIQSAVDSVVAVLKSEFEASLRE